MRKRHQAILIKENAKNKIINELTLPGRTEIEQQYKLKNFYEEFIPENDIEIAPKINTLINGSDNKLIQLEDINKDEFKNDDDSDCNEDIEITDINLPTYDEKKLNSLPDLKFQILEGADLCDFNFDNQDYIKEEKIKINNTKNFNYSKYKNFQMAGLNKSNTKKLDKTQNKFATFTKKNTTDKIKNKKENNQINLDNNINIENNRILNCGTKLKFNDIINQLVYWTEESKNKKSKKGGNKEKKKRGSVMYEIKINLDMILPKVNGFELFNINPKKTIKIKEKILEIQKLMKNKGNLTEYDQNIINGFLGFQNDGVNENNQNISRIVNDLEKIDSITYGDNWSIVNFKK